MEIILQLSSASTVLRCHRAIPGLATLYIGSSTGGLKCRTSPRNRRALCPVADSLAELLPVQLPCCRPLSRSGPMHDNRPNDPFIVLLKGLYRPAPQLPDLGLSDVVDLADASYITTKIYPVFGVPGSRDQDDAIGRFYVSFNNPVCIYDLPDGAIAMQFASSPVHPDIGFNTFVPFPDGQGRFVLWKERSSCRSWMRRGSTNGSRAGITTWWIDCINWTRRGRNSTNFASATSAAINSHNDRQGARGRTEKVRPYVISYCGAGAACVFRMSCAK